MPSDDLCQSVILPPHLKNPSQSGMNLTSLLLPDFSFLFQSLADALSREDMVAFREAWEEVGMPVVWV